MPEEKRADEIEKLLSEQKLLEDRKQALIEELLKQKEAAIKDFDEKLAKLGYEVDSPGRPKRSHHKKPLAPIETPSKTKAKAKDAPNN